MESCKRKTDSHICSRQRRRRIAKIIQQWENQPEPANESTNLSPANAIIDPLPCPKTIERAYSNDSPDSLTSSDESCISIESINNSLPMDNYPSSDEKPHNDRNITSVVEVSGIETLVDCSQIADYVKTKLGVWAVDEKISHNSLRKLLNLLKFIPSLSTVLPSDPRTLLQTTKRTDIREVFPGEYHHFGLASSIQDVCDRIGNLKVDDIAIAINIDGVPLFKSSSAALWPILGNIIPYKEVFMIGVYYGHKKPQDANIYLNEFVEEAIELSTNGIMIGGKNYKFSIRFIIADAPAKSFILCVKNFNGFNSCTKCVTKGKTVKNRRCFPKLNAKRRTDEDFSNYRDQKYHERRTCLDSIAGLGLVSNVTLDYMHLILLGVVKKMLMLWIHGENNYRLGRLQIMKISKRLKNDMRPFIPQDFGRRPQSLEFLKEWKATEFRQFLLYTGPIVLRKILPENMYNHFMTLHVLIRILCDVEQHRNKLDYATQLAKHFITSFATIYGVHHLTHNVHGIIHLVEDARLYGSIEKFSAFKFENFMQTLKPMVRKSEKPLQQIARRCGEIQKMKTACSKYAQDINDHLVPVGTSLHVEGPLPENCSNPQYKVIQSSNFTIRTHGNADSCCVLKNGDIIDVQNIAVCRETREFVIIGRQLTAREDFYTIPCPSSLLGIHKVKRNTCVERLTIHALSDIAKKCVKLPHKLGFVIFPFLHDDNSV